MPKKYPPLTPDEVVAILLAREFVLHHTSGSHAHYRGTIKGIKCLVTVDVHYEDFLIAPEYPIPLK